MTRRLPRSRNTTSAVPTTRTVYVELIYTSATMGRLEDAKALVAELLEKHPDFTIEGYTSIHRFKDPAVVKLIRDNTAKAGMPQ